MSTPKLVKLSLKAKKRLRERAAAAKPGTKSPRSASARAAAAEPARSSDATESTAKTGGAAKASKGGVPSKASFIMSYGPDVPTRTIVDEGAKRGLKFTQNYVSRIRSLDKARRTRGTTAPKRAGGVSALVGRAPRGGRGDVGGSLDSREQTFVRLAIDLGLANAEKILATVKARLATVRF